MNGFYFDLTLDHCMLRNLYVYQCNFVLWTLWKSLLDLKTPFICLNFQGSLGITTNLKKYIGISRILKESNLFAMDILREFLESSTIHGLNYISTARVSSSRYFSSFHCFSPDQVGKDSLVFGCLCRIHRGWNPHCQVV